MQRLESSRPATSILSFTHIELELPALLAVAAQAPDFKRADLGDLAVQVHGHGAAFLAGAVERRLQRAQFIDLSLPFLDKQTRGVGTANRRAEKAELGLLADDQAEF